MINSLFLVTLVRYMNITLTIQEEVQWDGRPPAFILD
jgi:hypothetical protein